MARAVSTSKAAVSDPKFAGPGFAHSSLADSGGASIPPNSVAPSAYPGPTYPSPDAPFQRLSAQVSSVGDSAAAVDELGFDLYVNALADFLAAPNTHAPLTCSVEGSWGSGKSSFMLQLKNRLSMVAPSSRTIDFNAWKYDKQEELWAAFALKVTRSLREQTHWPRRFFGDLKLYFSRIKGFPEALKLATFALAWLAIFLGAGFIFVSFSHAGLNTRAAVTKQAIEDLSGGKSPEKNASSNAKPAPPVTVTQDTDPTPAQMAGVRDIHYWLGQSTWVGAGIVLLALLWKLPESFRKRLFSTQIEQYIDKPDYKGRAAFLDSFTQDFARTLRAYSRNNAKIFVFIDDLDRCEAPKAADLMQAINLMIGEGNSLIFILGLDRAKVAAAISFKFREIIPYLDPSLDLIHHPVGIRTFGDNFLEKFIQLSFRLPISSNEAQARKFIDSLITGSSNSARAATSDPAKPTSEATAAAAAESTRRALRIESGTESQRIKDIVMMVREVLEYSPRRIKTFLNAFRLSLYIASAQGLLDIDEETGKSEVTPEKLGKFLALTSRYPDLREIVLQDLAFFGTLEDTLELRHMGKIEEAELEPRALWLKKPGVSDLLRHGQQEMSSFDWSNTYSLHLFPAEKFYSILPSIPPPNTPDQTAVAVAVAAAAQGSRTSDIYQDGTVPVDVVAIPQNLGASNAYDGAVSVSAVVAPQGSKTSDIYYEGFVPADGVAASQGLGASNMYDGAVPVSAVVAVQGFEASGSPNPSPNATEMLSRAATAARSSDSSSSSSLFSRETSPQTKVFSETNSKSAPATKAAPVSKSAPRRAPPKK